MQMNVTDLAWDKISTTLGIFQYQQIRGGGTAPKRSLVLSDSNFKQGQFDVVDNRHFMYVTTGLFQKLIITPY